MNAAKTDFEVNEYSTMREIERAHCIGKIGVVAISKAVGIGQNKFRRLLTAAKFEYNDTTKRWHFAGQDESLLDLTVLQMEKRMKGELMPCPNEKPSTLEVAEEADGESEIQAASPIELIIPQPPTDDPLASFSAEDIETLHTMIARFKAADSLPTGSLLEDIGALPPTKREKQTIALPSEIVARLADVAQKYRVQKSEIIAAALVEYLKRF